MTIRPPSDASLKSLEATTVKYEQAVELARDFLVGRGFSRSTAGLFRLGVVNDPEPGHEDYAGRLAIPSIGIRGVVSLRFRCMESHVCKDADCPKYLGEFGAATRPFNTRALHEASDIMAIAEGELDAISLCCSGIPAVAVPGAKSWKAHYPRLFTGYSRVYVIGDGDRAGRELNECVSKALPNAIVVTMAQGCDVNDVYRVSGGAGVRELLGLGGATSERGFT